MCVSIYHVATDYMPGLNRPDIEHALGIDIIHQKRASALYLMKLKETRQLSQVALDDVVEGSRMIFSSTVQQLHSSVRAKLASLGMDETKLDDVFINVADPFDDLETRYKQETFFKEQFGLVVSYIIANLIIRSITI